MRNVRQGLHEQITLRWVAAGFGGVALLRHSGQMVENSPYDVRVFNARHDPYGTTALLTDGNVDTKDPFLILIDRVGG